MRVWVMADTVSKEVRSRNMAAIKSNDTTPEVAVRKYLFSQGFRYRKNVKGMPGKPDIGLRKYNTCIFVNGCFWHKHEGCKYFVWPKSNTEFWKEKIESNIERDKRNYIKLEEDGWKVVVVWECEIKNDFQNTMKGIIEQLEETYVG